MLERGRKTGKERRLMLEDRGRKKTLIEVRRLRNRMRAVRYIEIEIDRKIDREREREEEEYRVERKEEEGGRGKGTDNYEHFECCQSLVYNMFYTITILRQLLIYTSLKHSLL